MVPRVCTDRYPARESQTNSAALVRLLKQTIEAPQKRKALSEGQTHTKRKGQEGK